MSYLVWTPVNRTDWRYKKFTQLKGAIAYILQNKLLNDAILTKEIDGWEVKEKEENN